MCSVVAKAENFIAFVVLQNHCLLSPKYECVCFRATIQSYLVYREMIVGMKYWGLMTVGISHSAMLNYT